MNTAELENSADQDEATHQNGTDWFYNAVMHPSDADEMAFDCSEEKSGPEVIKLVSCL